MKISHPALLNTRLYALLVFMVTAMLAGCSTDTSYIDGMPTAENANEQFKSKFVAKDSMNTCAKRVGGLRQLSNIIRNVIGYDRTLTPKENTLAYQYRDLSVNIENDYSRSLKSARSKKEFEQACRTWEEDGYLEDMILDSLLPAKAKQVFNGQYKKIKKAPVDTKNREKLKGKIYIGIGIAMFIGWFLIGVMLGKNKFNRTNQHGVQEFKNYHSLFNTELSEGCISWIAYFLLLLGFGFLIYGVTLIT